MELIYRETLSDPRHLDGVWRLLCDYGDSFVPPLSRRADTCQSMLRLEDRGEESGPLAYFDSMRRQPFLLAVQDGTVEGFFTFRFGYVPPPLAELDKPGLLGLYVSTIIVSDHLRRRGTASGFYAQLGSMWPERDRLISTRTWSGNESHICLLEKLGFSGPLRLADDRGPGIDTVYYHKFIQGGGQ